MKRHGVFSYMVGSPYEIGRKQAKELSLIPGIKDILFKNNSATSDDVLISIELLTEFYPSLLEELRGVSDWYEKDIKSLKFLDSACLISGGCSLAAISNKKMINGKSYVLRTYDLGENISDFRMCTTNMNNVFNHSGFSVNFFGRSDGMNEHGLCVAFASCGLPVGNEPGMLKTKYTGLNFMILVRLILEKCKTTSDALDFIQKIPIATNMNLLISDRTGKMALVEAIDGQVSIGLSTEPISLATNHPLFSDGKKLQKEYLNNSDVRLKTMYDALDTDRLLSVEDIRKLMINEYPKGLSMTDYQNFFGTVHSVLFNISDGIMEFSFGSPQFNPTYEIKVGEDLQIEFPAIELPNKKYDGKFWEMKSFPL